MKKALAKRVQRILSSLTAIFLALSCFAGSLAEPLLAGAEEQDLSITVRVLDRNNNPSEILENTVGGSGGGNNPEFSYYQVYVLAWLVDINDQSTVVAWNQDHLKQAENGANQGKTTFPQTITFNEFHPYGTDSTDPVRYDPTKHVYKYRVYNYGRQQKGWSWPITYDDLYDYTYDDFMSEESKASDTFLGYKPVPDGTTFTLNRHDVYYNYKLTFDKPVTITEDDMVYTYVKVNHSTTGETYFIQPVACENATEVVFNVQDEKVNTLWLDSNGNPTNDRFNASETETVEAGIFLGQKKGLKKFDKNSCTMLGEGSVLNGAKLVSNTSNKDTSDPHKTVVENTIAFKVLPEAKKEYDYKSILGTGIYYGITADRLEQGNHIESNFAVNYYESSGDAVEPDLSGRFGGHFYIANFVKFTDEIGNYTGNAPASLSDFNSTLYSTDDEGTVYIGEKCCELGTVVHVDKEDRIKIQRSFAAKVIEDPTTMTNTVIEPNIAQMKQISAVLAAKEANVSAVNTTATKILIDTTDYAPDATLYVDADAIADYIASGNLTLRIREDQTIVFNYTKKSNITLKQFNVEKVYADGSTSGEKDTTSPPYENTLLEGSKNGWLDQNVTRNLVWNLASAENVVFNATTGIFLLPKNTSKGVVSGTSSGWLISDGYIFNNSGEWHFLFEDMPGCTAELSINKTDITGSAEVEGADIEILDEEGQVVESWTSSKELTGSTLRTFALAPGKYTLRETAYNNPDETSDVKYKVITTTVSFSVVEEPYLDSEGNKVIFQDKNGNDITLMKAKVVIDETSDGFTVDVAKGYYYKDSDTQITLRNAADKNEKEAVAVIRKVDGEGKDITSSYEFTITNNAGESLTLTEKSTSVTLPEGDYVLKETVQPTGYVKLTDTYSFGIDREGRMKPVPPHAAAQNGFKVTAERQNDGTDVITIEVKNELVTDEEIIFSKTDLGGEEIEGAAVKIYDLDDAQTAIASWTSGSDGRDNSGKLKPHTVNYSFTYGKTYVYEETTAPAGYTVTEKVYFKIDETGKVLVSADNRTFTAPATAETVVLVDAPIEFTVKKTDLNGNEIADTVVFRINREDGSPVIENLSFTGSTLISAPNLGLAPGQYTLVEVTAPEGYDTAESMVFFITEDGKVTDDAGVAFTDNIIIVKDSILTAVTISKKDVAGTEEIAGAHLKILDAEKNPATDAVTGAELSWTSDAKEAKSVTLKDGVYFLVETPDAGADGFFTNSDGRKFKITESELAFEVKNGKVVETSAQTGFDSTSKDSYYSADGNTLYVCDAEIFAPAELTVSKTDITGTNELKGASLQIYTDSNCTTLANDVDGKEAKWTSDGENKWVITLADGTYYLKETGDEEFYDEKTDKWYTVIESTMKFTIENGKVTSVEGAENEVNKQATDETPGYFAGKAGSNTFTVCDAAAPEKTVDVTISKKDIAGSANVKNAQISIFTDSDCTEFAINLLDSKNADWTSDGKDWTVRLGNGVYYLKETAAAGTDGTFKDGDVTYKIVDSVLKFEVKNGAVISVEGAKDAPNASSAEGYFLADKDNAAFTVCDAKRADIEAEISIDKFSGEDRATRLPGSTFVISDAAGSPVAELSPDARGAKSVSLAKGTYTITEQTPVQGYAKITESVTFVIDADGNVTVDTNQEAFNTQSENGWYTYDGNAVMFKAYDKLQKYSAELKKTDGSVLISGAKLRVVKGNEIIVAEFDSTDTAAKITDSVFVMNTVYTLEETEAPAGYLPADPISFKFGADGKLYVFKDGDWAEAESVEMVDEKTSVKISKTDMAGEEIADAQLTVTVGDTDTSVDSWTSVKGQSHDIEGLEIGVVYKLTEVQEPKGYAAAESIYFKLDEQNNVTVSDKADGTFTAVENATVVMKDAKLASVTITKRDITGENEIDGATITVKGTDNNFTLTWTSTPNEKEKTFELGKGTYTLTETGDKITTEDGNEYKVITSTVTFVVDENGKITSVTGTDVKDQPDAENKDGYYLVDNSTEGKLTIKVCDAEKPEEKAEITITKRDITGENEIDGATITVKGTDNNFTLTWTSTPNEKEKTFELGKGTYTLTETGDKITTEDGDEYKVITSTVTFVVDENGKITSVTGTDVKDQPDAENKDGYYLVDNSTEGKLVIKVCDAKKSSDEEAGGDNPGGDDTPGEGDDTPGGEDKPGDGDGTDGGDDTPGKSDGDDDKPGKSDGEDDTPKGGEDNDGRKTDGDGEDTDGGDDEGGKKPGGDDETPNTGAGAAFAPVLLIGAAAIVLAKRKEQK